MIENDGVEYVKYRLDYQLVQGLEAKAGSSVRPRPCYGRY